MWVTDRFMIHVDLEGVKRNHQAQRYAEIPKVGAQIVLGET